MSETDQTIELRLSVFQSESPSLYAFVAALPSSRSRKRYALLKVLEAGISVVTGQVPPPQVAPVYVAPIVGPAPTLVATPLPVAPQPVMPTPVVPSNPVPTEQSAPPDEPVAPQQEAVVDFADLAEHFGTR